MAEELTGIIYIGEDPVSGKSRYYDLDAGLSSLSDTPPTANQLKRYQAEEARQAKQALPSNTDTAANKLSNDNPNVPATETSVPSNTPPGSPEVAGEPLSDSEKNNLDNPVTDDAVTDEALPPLIDEDGVTPAANSDSDASLTPESPADQINTPPVTVTERAPLVNLVNELHQYPSYTYGISLHMLTPNEYNQVVGGTLAYVPKRVLIASANRYNPTGENFKRSKHFETVFYIDNLNLESIIGLGEVNRSTNTLKYSFDIVEPYGMTLLNRILDLCAESDIAAENYLEMPYLLQVDFFAINDAGEIQGALTNLTKRFPIRILKMDIRANTKGAEYRIEAGPYAHSAYDLTTVSNPSTVSVTARTIGSFFQSTEKETFITDADNERENDKSLLWQTDSGQLIGPDGTVQYIPKSQLSETSRRVFGIDPKYKVKSYGSALNEFQKDLVRKNKIEIADEYYFKFHKDIEKAQFVIGAKNSPKNTAMTNDTGEISVRKGNIQENTNELDYNIKEFTINAGTSIDTVLNYIIRNSDFIQGQFVVPEDYGTSIDKYLEAKKKNEKAPLIWFKIVPTVELGTFDKIKRKFSRKITYNVVPYVVFNVRSEIAPQGTVTRSVKKYEYMYTGKNSDILDFNIEFNAMYYTLMYAYRENLEKLYPSKDTNSKVLESKNPDAYQGSSQNPNAVQPIRVLPVINSRGLPGSGASSSKDVASNDVSSALFVAPGADMIDVKLKIIGDPHFIKQDDVFYGPAVTDFSTDIDQLITTDREYALTPNGSIVTDSGELYVNLIFRTPTDIDESTGLMNFEKNQTSVFSGMYSLRTVDSVFANGQFIQTLTLVRLDRQAEYDYSTRPVLRSDEREELAPPDQTNNTQLADQPKDGANTTETAQSDDAAPDSTPVPDTAEDVPPNAEAEELSNIRETAPTDTVNATNQSPTTSTIGVEPATVTKLPDGVTQDPRSGNYTYKGLVIPADPGTSQFNQYVTAVDNKQTIQVTQIDNVSGNPITRTFNGNYTEVAVQRAQDNLASAERDVARFEERIKTDPTYQNADAQVALARRKAAVDAAKSDLAQAKAGNNQ